MQLCKQAALLQCFSAAAICFFRTLLPIKPSHPSAAGTHVHRRGAFVCVVKQVKAIFTQLPLKQTQSCMWQLLLFLLFCFLLFFVMQKEALPDRGREINGEQNAESVEKSAKTKLRDGGIMKCVLNTRSDEAGQCVDGE